VKPVQLKYKEVEKEMRQLAQTLPAGAKLPPERHLAIVHNCNFLTVRKALKTLVDEQLIVRRMGSGTFVTDKQSLVGRSATPSQVHRENRVGILVYQGGNSYSYKVLQALAHIGLSESIDLRSGWVGNFRENALAQCNLLAKEGCAALTIPWFPMEMSDDVKSLVQASPIPVSLPLVLPGLEKNSFEKPELFGTNTISATQTLCRYYHLLGHRQIALLGPDAPRNIVLQQALSSYSSYTSREDLPNIVGLVSEGAQAMDALAQRWTRYKGNLAIISYDDEQALRFMTSMHKIGLNAPVDYCIVGYNNMEASRFSDPPLSTVCQNFDYIAHWLLQNALALSKGQVAQADKSPVLQLLVRATCGGRDKLSPDFQSQLPDLNVVLESAPAGHHKKAHFEHSTSGAS